MHFYISEMAIQTDAPLIINDKGRCYENEVASSVATYIDQMSKKKSNEARAKKKWGKKAAKKVSKGRTYTFYHHGNTMKLVIYDEYNLVSCGKSGHRKNEGHF